MGAVDVGVFAVLAFVIVVGALKALNAKEVMHAVVWLAVVLAGTAGIYLTLGAQLLAAFQILIYVGAVVTLFLFTVMVTSPAAPGEGFGEDRTPLGVLGFPAPRGVDIESIEELPDEGPASERGGRPGAAE